MFAHAVLDPQGQCRLLSATAFVHNGFLTARGDATSTNSIDVAFSSDHSAVDVSIHSVNSAGKTSNFSQTYAVANVRSVTILGGTKGDITNVGQSGPAFNLVIYVNGGAGNDSITTGAESDIIDGGAGNDADKLIVPLNPRALQFGGAISF